MRVLAIILVLVTALVGVFLVYANQGMDMEIYAVEAATQPAVNMIDTYDDIRAQLDNGSFYGTRYREVDFLMPDGFAFLTLNVYMENKGMLPMEWIRIEVTPDASDVLQLPTERTPSLAAKTRGQFSTTILTRSGADEKRTVTVTYYVLGKKMTAVYVME